MVKRAEVTALWAERLRDPFRKPRARYGWVYPFVIPNGIVQKLGMEPLHTRLSRTLCDAATAYSEAVASNRPIDKLEKALRLQTSALRVWGQTAALLGEGVEEMMGHVSLARQPRRLVTPVGR